MVHHFVDGGKIGYDKTVEAPFCAQDVGEQKMISGSWHAVVVVKRSHHGSGTRFHCCFVRRQVVFAKKALAHVHRVVVAASCRRAIGSVMFHAGHHRLGVANAFALKTLYPGLCNAAPEPGVLSGPLGHAAPAGVPAYIHHGRERPVQTGSSGFCGGHLSRCFHGFQIPTGCFAQRNGENGFIPVNDIVTKNQRNFQARLLHRYALQLAGKRCGVAVEQCPAAPFADVLLVPCPNGRPGRFPVGGEQRELTNFFFYGHQRQHRVHPLVYGFKRHFGPWLDLKCHDAQHQESSGKKQYGVDMFHAFYF